MLTLDILCRRPDLYLDVNEKAALRIRLPQLSNPSYVRQNTRTGLTSEAISDSADAIENDA